MAPPKSAFLDEVEDILVGFVQLPRFLLLLLFPPLRTRTPQYVEIFFALGGALALAPFFLLQRAFLGMGVLELMTIS